MRCLWSVWLVPSLSLVSRAAEVYVYEPENGRRYYTLADGAASVPVHFDVFGSDSSAMGCLRLQHIDSLTWTLDSTCMEVSQLRLNHLAPGRYKLSLYPEGSAEHTKDIEFEVLRLEDAVPDLLFPALESNIVTVALPEGSSEAPPVTFSYELTNAGIPLNRFRVCVKTQDSPKPVCFPFDRKDIVLSHLSTGSYMLSFEVSLSQEPYTSFPHSRREVEIQVLPLLDVLPSIVTSPQDELDYSVASAGDTATVTLNFDLIGVPSAIQLVQTCIQVEHMSSNEEPLLRMTCLAPNDRSLQLFNMRKGDYVIKLTLRSLSMPQRLHISSLREIPLYIRLPEEFLPTYEWQELKAWHTVPSGLEIRCTTVAVNK